jgi:beta-galactosidase/beta-glucuronidase
MRFPRWRVACFDPRMPRVSIDPPSPRPQLQRPGWISLDGPWEFAIDDGGTISDPRQVQWSATIEVPFAPETPRSGINNTSLFRSCWYRRSITVPRSNDRQSRVLLHFGAVDYKATVWANGSMVGSHEGGYTPFTCDLTGVLAASEVCELIVRAEDDPGDLEKPRGKQDWIGWRSRTRSGIRAPPASGRRCGSSGCR